MTTSRDDERRPGEGRRSNVSGNSIPAQLRRRREAAWRLPPLEKGHRDPLDDIPAQRSTAKFAGVTVDENKRTVLVRGYGLRDLLLREGMRPMWSAVGRGFVLDLKRLPDIVAVLEWAGYRVTVRERGEAA